MQTAIYSHMVSRMNKDLIAFEIVKKEMEASLRSKELILAEQNDESRKWKEKQLQRKAEFDNLMRSIGDEQNDRKKRISNMNKQIRTKEENVLRREEREKHQRDIAEIAANENKDANEKTMRNKFMVNKLWNSFMQKKMREEMKNSAEIDAAFQEIKIATGVNDVQELVHKFLTREQTYSELLVAVADSEARIDNLKKENENLRNRLQQANAEDDDEDDGKEMDVAK